MDNYYPFKTGHDRYQLGYIYHYKTDKKGNKLYRYKSDHVKPEVFTEADVQNKNTAIATRKVILGDAMVNTFLPRVHDLAVTKNLQIEAYMFDYNHGIADYSGTLGGLEEAEHAMDSPSNHSVKYFTTLAMAQKRKFGPLKLETSAGLAQAKDLVVNKANMKLTVSDHTGEYPAYGQSTNTGFALLTALEILQQMKDQGVENRYMILLTDGVPSAVSIIKNNTSYTADSRPFYNSINGYKLGRKYDYSGSMGYIRRVTNSTNGNNPKDLYKKAYLIGFSGVASEKEKLGFPVGGSIPPDSINAYLRQTGNEVQTYDADNTTALDEALQAIVTDIGVSMGVFDGPDKMK